MSFAASKILWFLVQPSSIVLVLMLAGALLGATYRLARLGRRLLWLGIAGLVVGGLSPLGNLVVLPLEQRFPVPAIVAGDTSFASIIVLGGAEVGDVGAARGQLSLNEAAERVTEGLRLAHLLPKARLVFTGGAARVVGSDVPGAPQVAAFWQAAGIAPERIVVEAKSLTTWENALFTAALLEPAKGGRHLLVTTAHHMPRSVGVFRKAGLDVVAYPADFRTTGTVDLLRPFDAFPKGFRRLDDATKEWVGLAGYWLTGRSSALFPAP